MAAKSELVKLIDESIDRLNADLRSFDHQMQDEARVALEDWVLMEACKDYDTIELSDGIIGKAHRKQYKALRDKRRNTEKMLEALQALRESAVTPEGEKLRKKFEAEAEKYG